MGPSWPPAYRITTSRLALRCFEPADAPALKELLDRSPQLAAALELSSEPAPVEHMLARVLRFRRAFDAGEAFHYAAHVDGALCGSIAIEPLAHAGLLLGGWVAPDHARRGLATHASAAVCQVAFTIGGARFVEAHTTPDNTAIIHMLRELGFVHEATLAARVVSASGTRDQMIWTLWPRTFALSDVSAIDSLDRVFTPSPGAAHE